MANNMADPKSITDYVSVMVTLTTLPVAVVSDTVANMFAGKKRRAMIDTLLDSVMGHCYRLSTLRQLRILTPVHPLKDELNSILYTVLLANVKLNNFNGEFKGDGFTARWISEIPNRKPSDPVIVYMHGGGYSLKTCQPQVTYVCNLARALSPYRVSILALDYGIAPFYKYPHQRNEGVACVKKLLESCNKPILVGDSCGANLALTILLEESVIPAGSIYGCVLISPWTDTRTQDGSMNSTRDILNKKRLNEMRDNFVDSKYLNDPKINLIDVDPKVWERVLPANVCAIWGENECFYDQILAFTKKAGITNCFIERNGTHDCILRGLSPPPCQFVTDCLIDWVTDNNFVLHGTPAKRSKSLIQLTNDGSTLHRSPSFLKRSGSLFAEKLGLKTTSSNNVYLDLIRNNAANSPRRARPAIPSMKSFSLGSSSRSPKNSVSPSSSSSSLDSTTPQPSKDNQIVKT